MNLDNLKWNDQGLVAVVAQNAQTGEVRMMAYANLEAVKRTLQSREAHFYSRSRKALWKKGQFSGNTMHIREVWVDCDGDALLYLVEPQGPSCHTGASTCFYRRVTEEGTLVEKENLAVPTLSRLEHTLSERTRSTAQKSYTKSLLNAGASKIGAKVCEEATEWSEALSTESDERVCAESADVLYHLLVGLLFRDLSLRDVLQVLSSRFDQSGHEEKTNR